VGTAFGEEIRGCLYVENPGYEFCGSDISGLEDNTKQHYIYIHDQKYVEDMRVPGYDPHLDIAVLAKMMSFEEGENFKILDAKAERTEEENKELKRLKGIRGKAKSVNFAATYNAFPPKIAELLKGTLKEAKAVFDVYWQRNWAVKKTAEEATIKTLHGQQWLYNPISEFWMFLKADKDRFSTLNQSSGVYVFDTWLNYCYRLAEDAGIDFVVVLQYHDEILVRGKKKDREKIRLILENSMAYANEYIKLNVEIKISTSFGKNYAEVH
jgi:hypothetical protein